MESRNEKKIKIALCQIFLAADFIDTKSFDTLVLQQEQKIIIVLLFN